MLSSFLPRNSRIFEVEVKTFLKFQSYSHLNKSQNFLEVITSASNNLKTFGKSYPQPWIFSKFSASASLSLRNSQTLWMRMRILRKSQRFNTFYQPLRVMADKWLGLGFLNIKHWFKAKFSSLYYLVLNSRLELFWEKSSRISDSTKQNFVVLLGGSVGRY